MSDRSIKFYKNMPCDNCGKTGAFDFMGDYYCTDCAIGCKRCLCVFIKDLKNPTEDLCPDCRKDENDSSI
jgi:hypothetical protein